MVRQKQKLTIISSFGAAIACLVLLVAARTHQQSLSPQLIEPPKSQTQSTPSSTRSKIDQPKSNTTSTQATWRPTPLPANTSGQSFEQTKPVSKHASKLLSKKDYDQKTYTALLTPNDTYGTQWPTTSVGMPQLWDTTTGNSNTIIAIIDTGYALSHQDLDGRWYQNPGETGMTQAGDSCWNGSAANKQLNGCDDDENGYQDDWRGWDFFWVDNDPAAGSVSPNGAAVDHGTSVAGIIGATGNNNVGVTGIDWQAKLMPLQVLSDNGTGFTNDIVAAIEYAADNGADVINLSLGGFEDDPGLLAAVRYAASKNVVVIAASGNCGDSSTAPCNSLTAVGKTAYPALYDEVIAVGALTQSNARPSFGSYGDTLDIAAPGASYPVALSWSAESPTSLYTSNISGTSFAAPMVSGIAGLLKAADPNLSGADVRGILLDSADKLTNMNGQLWTNEYGYGRINGPAAYRLAITRSLARTAGAAPRTSDERVLIANSIDENTNSPINGTTSVTTTCSSYPGDTCQIVFTNASSGLSASLEAQKVDNGSTAAWEWTPNGVGLTAGTWVVRAHGNGTASTGRTLVIE